MEKKEPEIRKRTKKYKSTCITLLSGKKLRIMKSEVVDAVEQAVIGGGV